MRLIFFAIYLGIGAMLHALFVGPHFDWSSAWTFGWLFGWPIMVVISSASLLLMAGLLAILFFAVWHWLDLIAHWRESRRRRS